MLQIISFMSDFGIADTSVGQCKGVIAAISPKATVIDITHAVPHFDVSTGAWLLRNAAPHFPPCVHVAVVDPGVGTGRRAVAVECGRGDLLVGPDNGLLLPAAEQLGGITGAVELANAQFHHTPVSNTFHARDIFCPVAAHVIHGVTAHLLGPTLDPAGLVRLPEPEASVRNGVLATEVIAINEYGSLLLAAPGTHLEDLGMPRQVRATVGDVPFPARIARTFGEASPGERILIVDSSGHLCLSMNRGDLADALGLGRTARPRVSISPITAEAAGSEQ